MARRGIPGVSTLLKTVDGGSNWSPVNLNLSSNLQSIFFPNNQIGYIVGWDGEILKTEDSGSNWASQNSVNMNGNLDVFFTDDDTGYIVGGDVNQGSIQKTNNGGALWEEIGPGNTYGLVGVFFPSQNVGYAVGGNGTILKTASGGTSSNIEVENLQNIQCYPNPVSNTFVVKTSKSVLKAIKIYNNQGALMQEIEANSDQSDIDFSALAPDIYYVLVEAEHEQVIKKIIKL